jgi:hypothetical protein
MVYNQNYQFEVNLSYLKNYLKSHFFSRISAQKVLKVLLNLTIFSYCHNDDPSLLEDLVKVFHHQF